MTNRSVVGVTSRSVVGVTSRSVVGVTNRTGGVEQPTRAGGSGNYPLKLKVTTKIWSIILSSFSYKKKKERNTKTKKDGQNQRNNRYV